MGLRTRNAPLAICWCACSHFSHPLDWIHLEGRQHSLSIPEYPAASKVPGTDSKNIYTKKNEYVFREII